MTTQRNGRALIRVALEYFGTDLATLRQARKGDWRKALLAAMIQKETTVRLDWITGSCITEQLHMGTRARALAAWRPNTENVSPPIPPCGGRSKQYRKEQY